MTTFPKPWKVIETSPTGELCVVDANDRKLFYIKHDEGEGEPGEEDYIEPSALEYGTDAESAELIGELLDMFAAEEP